MILQNILVNENKEDIEKCFLFNCQSLSTLILDGNTSLTYLSIKHCPCQNYSLPSSLIEFSTNSHTSLQSEHYSLEKSSCTIM